MKRIQASCVDCGVIKHPLISWHRAMTEKFQAFVCSDCAITRMRQEPDYGKPIEVYLPALAKADRGNK